MHSTIDRRNRLTSFSILNVPKMTGSSVNKDTNRTTNATQERSHTGNHIVVVVMIVQVDLLLGCGSMVNDSVPITNVRTADKP
jgi:hypothetical protein